MPEPKCPDCDRRAEERRLLDRYARVRDPQVLDELVRRYMPLAKRLALRYRSTREPLEDLIQVASVGLVNAISRFDPARGYEFASFAVPTILGELRRHFRDRAWGLHVNRGLRERNALVEKAIRELTAGLGRSPSTREIAERLEISAEDVLEAVDAGNAHQVHSLDRAANQDDRDEPPALGESLGEEDPGYDTVEYGAAIAPTLATLPRRERVVLHLRFVEDLTQSEIARRVGVSQMHVSRILRATLKRLREGAAEDHDAAPDR